MAYGISSEGFWLPERSRRQAPFGRVLVESGLVFRFRDGSRFPDGMAGAGCALSADEDDLLLAPWGAALREAESCADCSACDRDLLWVREGGASQRVARALRVLVRLLGSALPAGLQNNDIALVAAVRHETVSRALAGMERDGAVRILNDRQANRQIQVVR